MTPQIQVCSHNYLCSTRPWIWATAQTPTLVASQPADSVLKVTGDQTLDFEIGPPAMSERCSAAIEARSVPDVVDTSKTAPLSLIDLTVPATMAPMLAAPAALMAAVTLHSATSTKFRGLAYGLHSKHCQIVQSIVIQTFLKALCDTLGNTATSSAGSVVLPAVLCPCKEPCQCKGHRSSAD